ncbi:MAG: hypothetical protein WKG07_48190 [Hymenobacter sp.]
MANYSWLDGLSHPGLRERFLAAFDDIWIDNLNGDKYATGKTHPRRPPRPLGVQHALQPRGHSGGAAVALLARTAVAPTPRHRAMPRGALPRLLGQGQARRAGRHRRPARPHHRPRLPGPHLLPALGLPFKPRAVADEYLTWPTLPEVFPASFSGVQTKRDEMVVDIDRDALERRMLRYFDASISDSQIAQEMPRAMETERFDPIVTSGDNL